MTEEKVTPNFIPRMSVLNTIYMHHSDYEIDEYSELMSKIENLSGIVLQTGHWIKDKEMSIMFDIWTCSECGCGGDKHFKYCPHCGVKMEGE